MTLFQEALALEGLPPARVVSWVDFLNDFNALGALPDEALLFRIDSLGENDAVERWLLNAGWPRAKEGPGRSISPADLAALPPSLGRIICPRQAHFGFELVLTKLQDILAAHPKWRCLNPPEDIRELFDKRVTSLHYEQLGIPVPDALRGITSIDELREGMRSRGWTEVFIKMSAGSSASCLGVVRLHRGGQFTMHTTIEQASDGWFNTLKVRHVTNPRLVAELLEFLLNEGSQIERSIPKARLAEAYFDLRVLCIAHEPRFIVVRQNHHPITNLHLGGWRGELDELKKLVSPAAWEAAMNSCRAVAKCYQALHVGIDLMFEADFVGHRIIEANAFGDLLPRLELEGRNVWQWQIEAALSLTKGLPRRATKARAQAQKPVRAKAKPKQPRSSPAPRRRGTAKARTR